MIEINIFVIVCLCVRERVYTRMFVRERRVCAFKNIPVCTMYFFFKSLTWTCDQKRPFLSFWVNCFVFFKYFIRRVCECLRTGGTVCITPLVNVQYVSEWMNEWKKGRQRERGATAQHILFHQPFIPQQRKTSRFKHKSFSPFLRQPALLVFVAGGSARDVFPCPPLPHLCLCEV